MTYSSSTQDSAPRAWCKQFLSGRRKPDVLRPDIVGMQGSTGMVIRLRPCMTENTTLGLCSFQVIFSTTTSSEASMETCRRNMIFLNMNIHGPPCFEEKRHRDSARYIHGPAHGNGGPARTAPGSHGPRRQCHGQGPAGA